MTEQVEQQSCIKFCIKAWTFLCGNYSDDSEGHSYGQLVIGSFITTMRPLITSHAVFLWNIKSPRWLSPLQPRFGALPLLAFPKTQITFEREKISNHQWDSEKIWQGSWLGAGDWENCVRSQGAYFEGHWEVIVLCIMFLVLVSFFNKCLYFSHYVAGYSWTKPIDQWNRIESPEM